MDNEFGLKSTQQAEEKPQMNAVQRFFGVFFSPVKTFQDINRKPSFILPLVAWIILSLVATAVVMPRIDMEATMQQALEKRGIELTDEQIEKAASVQGKIGSVMGYIGGVISPILVVLVIGGIFFGIIRMWSAGSTFAKVFSVITHSFIVQFIKSIIFIPMVFKKESFLATEVQDLVKSNLTIFFNREETSAALYTLAGRIDIFSLWTLVLIIFGLTAVSKLNLKQSAIATIIMWLIFVAITVVWAAVFPS